MFSGNKIGSSLSPNSYPAKMRKAITIELAREVYEYLINNDYSFEKKVSTLELYDTLVAKKFAEPLSSTYKKTLNNLSVKLRHELQKKGSIKPTYIDSLILRYSNNTSYNTTRRHINVLVNFLKSNASKALDLLRPSDPNDLINKIKGSTNNFHIYTFGGLKETNRWLENNNYA